MLENFVYRIEDREGRGPYHSNYNCPRDLYNSYFCPGPTCGEEWDTTLHWLFNELSERHKKYVFGFKELQDVKNWFRVPEVNNKLSEAGFSLTTYSYSAIAHGNKQVAFIKDRLLDRMPLEQLLRPSEEPLEYAGLG